MPGLRSPALRLVLAVLMLATPVVLHLLSPQFGVRRGLWVALAGVAVAMVFERPFKPYNITQSRWVGREHWTEVALILGVLFGMTLSVVEALVSGTPLLPFLERIWVPLHRVVLFAGGLTMLRQAVWQLRRGRRNRGRVEFDDLTMPAVKPALRRPADSSQGGGESR